MTRKALIAGAGIGGLATAAALGQRGWDVTVYERHPELRVNGSGIYLWNNGLAVLSEIGAYDRAMRNAFLATGVEQRDHLGNAMVPAELPPGARVVAVHRSDLHAGLTDAATRAGARIVTGTEVVEARADGSLFFASGDSAHGDVVIGTDGAWSPVRNTLGLLLSQEQTREGALRTVVKATQAEMPVNSRGHCIECWNGQRRLLITPINDEEVYLALTCPASDSEGRDTAIQSCWKASFPDWAFLLDRITGPVTWNVYSLVKCRSWSAGNACILGDAAHATTPNLGQGGGMAMQNGLALAAHLAAVDDRRDVPSALQTWEAAMRPLVDHCQHWASLFGEIANIPNEVRAEIIPHLLANPWLAAQTSRGARSEIITQV